MPPTLVRLSINHLADMAAFVSGSFSSSRQRPPSVGAFPPRNRRLGGIGGAVTAMSELPAAKSGFYPSSRRPPPIHGAA